MSETLRILKRLRRPGLHTPPKPGALYEERIANGGFENGWNNWVKIDDPANIVAYKPHSGTYCMDLGMQSFPFHQGEIRQTLGTPTPVADVVSLIMWARRESAYGLGQLKVFYSDETVQTITIPLPTFEWTMKDYKADLQSGKTITKIGVWYTGEPAYNIWVDDLSLLVPA